MNPVTDTVKLNEEEFNGLIFMIKKSAKYARNKYVIDSDLKVPPNFPEITNIFEDVIVDTPYNEEFIPLSTALESYKSKAYEIDKFRMRLRMAYDRTTKKLSLNMEDITFLKQLLLTFYKYFNKIAETYEPIVNYYDELFKSLSNAMDIVLKSYESNLAYKINHNLNYKFYDSYFYEVYEDSKKFISIFNKLEMKLYGLE